MKGDGEPLRVKGYSSNRKYCGSLHLSRNVRSAAVKLASKMSRGSEKEESFGLTILDI